MRKIGKVLAAAVPVLTAAGLVAYDNNRVVATRYTVRSNLLPKPFSGFKIAQISDYHNCKRGDQVLEILIKERPDLIAVTGDFINHKEDGVCYSMMLAKMLPKIAPTYFVQGNHEVLYSKYREFKEYLKKIDIKVLENETVELTRWNKSVYITGVCDPVRLWETKNYKGASSPELTGAILRDVEIDTMEYNILLTHRPESFEVYKKKGYNLVLAGHAHGGQFIIPGIGGLFAPNQGILPRYYKGVYTDDDTDMVVSAGIGDSSFPFRLNNPPEVVVVTLKAEKL